MPGSDKLIRLRAGAAQVDITPPLGTFLSGSLAGGRPAQVIADPLYARTVLFEHNRRKLAFVTLDLTFVSRHYTTLIRQAAAERLGVAPTAVMVHVTQNHSAPPLGPFLLDEDFSTPAEFAWGTDEAYNQLVIERVLTAMQRAYEALEPVQIAVGSGIEGRLAFNRRGVRQDGTVGMPGSEWDNPLGPGWIRYLEGPIDPELGVLCVRADSLRMVAMLLHYTCHPVHMFRKPLPIVTADWPGAWARELQGTHGEGCVPLVLNGACGNINPWSPYDPDYVEDHRRMGTVLAATTEKVIETLQFREETVLDWGVTHLAIPIKEVAFQELEEAQQFLAEHPDPLWIEEGGRRVDPRWMRAAGVVSVHGAWERDKVLDYEIQVLRVGQTAFVGLPGEPFVEGQLQIKLASPAYPTYVAHATTHTAGYIPTREAFPRGGHEITTANWARLAPEALELIVAGAVSLLNELFAKATGDQ